MKKKMKKKKKKRAKTKTKMRNTTKKTKKKKTKEKKKRNWEWKRESDPRIFLHVFVFSSLSTHPNKRVTLLTIKWYLQMCGLSQTLKEE